MTLDEVRNNENWVCQQKGYQKKWERTVFLSETCPEVRRRPAFHVMHPRRVALEAL